MSSRMRFFGGLAAVVLWAGPSHAGLVVHFAGTVDSFISDISTPHPNGPTDHRPGVTDIVPGSTFEGNVFWDYVPDVRSEHKGVYLSVPTVEFTVDHKSTFSSEMLPSLTQRHGGFGVIPSGLAQPGTEDIVFNAGYASTSLERVSAGVLQVQTASTLALNPHGNIDSLIAQDLGHFISGRFRFDFNDYVGSFFPYAEGHELHLAGNVTSLSIANPEPATIVSAGLGFLLSFCAGFARLRRSQRERRIA